VDEPECGHLRNGAFAPDALLNRLVDWSAMTFSKPQVRSARVVGDMSWAGTLLSPTLVKALVQSEVNITRWARCHEVIMLCLYDLERFSGELIIPMTRRIPRSGWVARWSRTRSTSTQMAPKKRKSARERR
jgi:hypothetical protein